MLESQLRARKLRMWRSDAACAAWFHPRSTERFWSFAGTVSSLMLIWPLFTASRRRPWIRPSNAMLAGFHRISGCEHATIIDARNPAQRSIKLTRGRNRQHA